VRLENLSFLVIKSEEDSGLDSAIFSMCHAPIFCFEILFLSDFFLPLEIKLFN